MPPMDENAPERDVDALFSTPAEGPSPASHAARSSREERRQEQQQRKLEALERRQLHKAEKAARGPGAWRTWVLPVLKLAVIAAIAIALVKLAFFPDTTEAVAEDPMAGAMFEEPMVAVERGSIENAVEIDGTIVPVEAVPIRSTQTGTVSRVYYDDGLEVAEGDVLFTVRVESEPEPAEDGTIGEPSAAIWNMRAPAAGTLTGFDLLAGQMIELGGEAGAVQPPQHLVRAAVGAADQYRLTSQPTAATVTIDSGPAPFSCTDVTITQPVGEEIASGSGATLTCAVPDDVRVFVGLSAKVELAAGSAADVLVVPTTAVLGSADVGIAYRPTTGADGAPGEPEEVRVELGISDGSMVEVRSGLAEGDQVLQFVPGAVDPCSDPMSADPALCGGEVFP
ncbi:efflux RND transporter periplasmic adaptor subunit [Agrococcus sp. ARC_14]|uniref:efflux RND transporter periplasmic adaptor subunit n=1 Tax=Agrococcus sp. ARC_14 TaxID=2919927 RepID=UPI001F0515D8|nr:efflux RND transporter periplasmic adaptor subunit [Agrococcus sp. ARC_14]MCH1883620.1 efflux RND transporter periplasmic adaptor subunit [Agrococcus sp. ARC_14]